MNYYKDTLKNKTNIKETFRDESIKKKGKICIVNLLNSREKSWKNVDKEDRKVFIQFVFEFVTRYILYNKITLVGVKIDLQTYFDSITLSKDVIKVIYSLLQDSSINQDFLINMNLLLNYGNHKSLAGYIFAVCYETLHDEGNEKIQMKNLSLFYNTLTSIKFPNVSMHLKILLPISLMLLEDYYSLPKTSKLIKHILENVSKVEIDRLGYIQVLIKKLLTTLSIATNKNTLRDILECILVLHEYCESMIPKKNLVYPSYNTFDECVDNILSNIKLFHDPDVVLVNFGLLTTCYKSNSKRTLMNLCLIIDTLKTVMYDDEKIKFASFKFIHLILTTNEKLNEIINFTFNDIFYANQPKPR
ncbi:hypothetical protein A3Q56_02677 [Intoshia linei]|uniref:Uncharacterized protein n=1 Tax=Intoshia linei TaxID=1819745 RepID=A0A177B639_9BILA|nr:hypothetical protein A3Q56_02677 [Intoshia linei]